MQCARVGLLYMYSKANKLARSRGRWQPGPQAASPAMEKMIDEEVKELVAKAYDHCKAWV